jgi:hypothetical protein
MPIAQIWEKERVSSPYILESVECNMCGWKIKNPNAYEKLCTKQKNKCTDYARSDRCPWPVRSSQHTQLGGTGQIDAPGRSDRSGPVRAQRKGVRAIWSKLIWPGLQAGLD